MRTRLKDLYYGNINPNEKTFEPKSEFSISCSRMAGAENKLRERINEEEKKLLSEILDASAQMTGIELTNMFVDGFRLGARLVIEVFCDDDKSFDGI